MISPTVVMMQGMVDPGEVVTTTVKREFIEEAMDLMALSEDDQRRINQQISDFFKNYSEVSAFVKPFTRKGILLYLSPDDFNSRPLLHSSLASLKSSMALPF